MNITGFLFRYHVFIKENPRNRTGFSRVNQEMGYIKTYKQIVCPQTTLERYKAKKKRDAANFKENKTSRKF